MVATTPDTRVNLVKFQLGMPPEVRARLESYVLAENRRRAPFKTDMTSVILAALTAYLDQQEGATA